MYDADGTSYSRFREVIYEDTNSISTSKLRPTVCTSSQVSISTVMTTQEKHEFNYNIHAAKILAKNTKLTKPKNLEDLHQPNHVISNAAIFAIIKNILKCIIPLNILLLYIKVLAPNISLEIANNKKYLVNNILRK